MYNVDNLPTNFDLRHLSGEFEAVGFCVTFGEK